jgi:cytochrome c-type biogenesis protein
MGSAFVSAEAPSLIAAFVAGVLSFLSPCVLPLVPGYLSLMSGLGSSPRQDVAQQRSRVVFSASLFIIGFTLVFVSYGAAASVIGSVLVDHKRLVTHVSGVLIIVMGLVVAGAFRITALMQERRFHVSPSKLGPYAAPVMGMAFAFGWTPCIGPVLAAVLTLAASRDTLNQGVGLLAVYSIGLGVPFLISAVLFDRFTATWGWFKRHGKTIDLVSGGILVFFGVLLLTGQLGRMSSLVLDWWSALGLDRLQLG